MRNILSNKKRFVPNTKAVNDKHISVINTLGRSPTCEVKISYLTPHFLIISLKIFR